MVRNAAPLPQESGRRPFVASTRYKRGSGLIITLDPSYSTSLTALRVAAMLESAMARSGKFFMAKLHIGHASPGRPRELTLTGVLSRNSYRKVTALELNDLIDDLPDAFIGDGAVFWDSQQEPLLVYYGSTIVLNGRWLTLILGAVEAAAPGVALHAELRPGHNNMAFSLYIPTRNTLQIDTVDLVNRAVFDTLRRPEPVDA